MTTGKRIVKARKEKGLSQEQLGEKLLMRKSTISDYENDVIDIKISVLREIAAALGTAIGDKDILLDMNKIKEE